MDLESQKKEHEEEEQEFVDEEKRAMEKAASTHVGGMQAAAAYNVGITATFFGCIQPHGGADSVTRIVKMPTPDAYNDLCCEQPVLDADGAPVLDASACRAPSCGC